VAAYPVITYNTTPVEITTASSSLSYSMLIATLNYISYKVNRLWMEASSVSQVGTQFQYNTVRPDGQQFALNKSGNVDPYQFLNVLDIQFEQNDQFILDNMSTLGFTLEPLANVQMYFFTDSVSDSYKLNDGIEDDTTILPVAKPVAKNNNPFLIAVAAVLIVLTTLYLTQKDE